MEPLLFASIIFFLSILGAVALFLRHVPETAKMTPEEVAGIYQQERPLSTQAWDWIGQHTRSLWHNQLRTRTFSFLLKQIHHLRLWALRIEQYLFRLGRSMRERSTSSRPPSEYWQDLHGWRKTVHWHKKKEE